MDYLVSVSDNQLCGNLSHLDQDEWYTLYCKTLRALLQTGQLAEAQTLSNSAIVSKRFCITLKRKLVRSFYLIYYGFEAKASMKSELYH